MQNVSKTREINKRPQKKIMIENMNIYKLKDFKSEEN